MTAFFDPLGGGGAHGGDGEEMRHVDPFLEREAARRRWPARAAAWRAAEIAELVFGGEVHVRLGGGSASGPFRGLLHLEVPFEGMDAHSERERVFVACAGRDEVLARVPMVFVFSPRVP